MDWGLILGKSGNAAKVKSYFKASLAFPAPHIAPLLSQAAVAGGLGQAGSVCSERAQGSLGSGTFTPNELLQR